MEVINHVSKSWDDPPSGVETLPFLPFFSPQMLVRCTPNGPEAISVGEIFSDQKHRVPKGPQNVGKRFREIPRKLQGNLSLGW